MGYQESVIPVESLAEVVGIHRAVCESEELKNLEYLTCFCAARARRDLYWGGWFGTRLLADVGKDEDPIYKEGQLFAVVGGARLYQHSPCSWIDCFAGLDECGYKELFEDIPLDDIRHEALENPVAAWQGEAFMRRHLNAEYNATMRGEHPIVLPECFKLQDEAFAAFGWQ